jgi:N-acetylglucosaminyldiphosphoundecaprenol N-acetyl-beta-D-mannosaminyltransferase
MDKKNRFGNKRDSLGDPKREKLNNGLGLSYWKIFDIPLFGRGMEEVLKIVENWIGSESKKKWIATVNPEFVMKAIKDEKFRNLLKETDLNVVDGVGLVWARQVSGNNFVKKAISGVKIGGEILVGKHKESLVSGSDLMPELCELASKKGYKVFFLGGFNDRAKRTAEYFRRGLKYDFCAGEPKFSNEEVLVKINQFKPDILFVAYGMKRQEEWIRNNRDKADFGVAIGVGRSFDYYSGDLKRAPKVWRKIGMEWLYSLIQEPKRWRRQLELPKFVWKVLTK